MPKSKKEMMQRLRKARKEAGLITVTYHLTPGQKKNIEKMLKKG